MKVLSRAGCRKLPVGFDEKLRRTATNAAVGFVIKNRCEPLGSCSGYQVATNSGLSSGQFGIDGRADSSSTTPATAGKPGARAVRVQRDEADMVPQNAADGTADVRRRIGTFWSIQPDLPTCKSSIYCASRWNAWRGRQETWNAQMSFGPIRSNDLPSRHGLGYEASKVPCQAQPHAARPRADQIVLSRSPRSTDARKRPTCSTR